MSSPLFTAALLNTLLLGILWIIGGVPHGSEIAPCIGCHVLTAALWGAAYFVRRQEMQHNEDN